MTGCFVAGSISVELASLQAQHVARELDHGALHTQTDSQERDTLCLAGKAHGLDLPLDTAVAEARSHEDTGHLAQLLRQRSQRLIFSELT